MDSAHLVRDPIQLLRIRGFGDSGDFRSLEIAPPQSLQADRRGREAAGTTGPDEDGNERVFERCPSHLRPRRAPFARLRRAAGRPTVAIVLSTASIE